MHSLAASVCLMMVWLSATAVVQGQGEWQAIELPNPSFESGDQTPDGWRALQGNQRTRSEGSTLAWDREHARTGTRSLYIRRGANGPLRWSTSEPVNVEPGATYRVRVWFRTNPENAGALSVGLASRRALPDTGKLWEFSRKVEFDADTQGQWREAVLEFTPPASVDQIWIRMADQNSWPPRRGPAVELWFDDIELQRQRPAGGS